jgi:lipoprotein-releasing system permease protein
MNLSYFISKRINRQTPDGFSATIHRIAIASIGIGLGASIVAFLIMRGFQETVQNKIYSFSGHLLINKFTMNNSMEESPMELNNALYSNYKQYGTIRHMQEYAHKAGLIKTDSEVLGVIIKGMGRSFDTLAFAPNLVEGRFIHYPDSGYSTEVVISSVIAKKLGVQVGDNLLVHFFQNPPRQRRLTITGIYETNLSEYFDGKVILGDIRLIARLNNWADNVAGGIEVFVHDVHRIDEAGYALGERIDFDLNVFAVSDKYIQVFEWLQLLSRQVNILLVIILGVVCVNMISIILILVMERTQMIGLLKALGSPNRLIRMVFIHSGIQLLVKGLALGNVLGLGLCYLQYRFKFITLNPQDYYMSFVPIRWEWALVGWLNLITFALVTLVLLIPTAIISRIDPIKAIRFD